MKSHAQLTIYFPDDLERIISNLEAIYLQRNNVRENLEDRFFDFMNLLRGFISRDLKRHYTYEDMERYIKTICLIDGKYDNVCLPYRAIVSAFDIEGEYKYGGYR